MNVMKTSNTFLTRINYRLLVWIIGLFCSAMIHLQAQDNTSILSESHKTNNMLYVNVMGEGSMISGNYERIFYLKPHHFIASSLGLGMSQELQIFCLYGNCDKSPQTYVTVNNRNSYNIGKTKHFLEVGFGIIYFKGNDDSGVLAYPLVGYRLQPEDAARANFRLYFNISQRGFEIDDFIFFPIGLSVGVPLK